MASAFLYRTLFTHRLLQSSFPASQKLYIFSPLFKIRSFNSGSSRCLNMISRNGNGVIRCAIAGARANYSTQSMSGDEPVVSFEWLHSNLRHPDLKVGPLKFQTKFQPHLVWMLEQVWKTVEDTSPQHIHARSKARFDEDVLEPRKAIRSGHVPGSKCIPFPQMLDSSQLVLPADELKKRFEQEGISLDKPVMTSCGTGVTACILALKGHGCRTFS